MTRGDHRGHRSGRRTAPTSPRMEGVEASMRTAHPQEQVTAFLAGHALFSPFGDGFLAELVPQLETVSFAMGEAVCTEGEPADCAYLVYSGKARVFKQGPVGKPVLLGT